MTETRAYLTITADDQFRVTIREGCGLYSRGTEIPGMSWTLPFADDGRTHLFGAEPDQPYADADEILAEHGWKREGRWAVGDSTTGTYADVSRAR